MASRRSHAPTNASKWNNSRLGYAMGGCVATAERRSHAPTNSQALAESSHANIVQRVKSCYKIKINSRESKSCFYGVMLCKQHQCLTIVPLLQSNSATIRV